MPLPVKPAFHQEVAPTCCAVEYIESTSAAGSYVAAPAVEADAAVQTVTPSAHATSTLKVRSRDRSTRVCPQSMHVLHRPYARRVVGPSRSALPAQPRKPSYRLNPPDGAPRAIHSFEA